MERRAIRRASSLLRLNARQLLLSVAITFALLTGSSYAAGAPAAADASASPIDASASPASASGIDASFDRSMLSGAGSNTTDLSRFERGNAVLAGTYSADIFLNGTWVGRRDVRFASASPQANATACVDTELLSQLGLHALKLSAELTADMNDPAACVAMGDLVPNATAAFDISELRLDISVPQAYMGQVVRGYVSPEYWDNGIPAGLLNYNFNSYRSSSQGFSQTSSYLGLNAGFNLGPWQLRQDSTLNWQSATGGASSRFKWQTINSYVRRDIPALRAQLTIGDSFTDGQVFDSFGVRGVQLATDDRMVPDSVRGYAPVVRGVANTNARVSIRQNGVEIYQTTVSPGPFEISDLYPTGYGGDLVVTVTEADGHAHTFSVAYASVAQLLRPGTTRFSVAAGQLRNRSLTHLPSVAQATIQHGLNNLLTGYAGLEISKGYGALLLGSAINTHYGAFAFDLTQSHAAIQGLANHSGQSLRLSYSKILPETNTSLSVAAYRYSTNGFLSLSDAALVSDYARRGLDAFNLAPTTAPILINGVPLQTALTPEQLAAVNGTAYEPTSRIYGLQRQRSRFALTLSQRLGAHGGSFYANASASDYWNRKGTDTQFQVGYNNSFHRVSYNISAVRSSDYSGHYNNQYNLTINVPLGESARAPNFSLDLSRGQDHSLGEQAMVNGTFGTENQFNYGATVNHRGADENGFGADTSGSINGGYRAPYATINASYGRGSGYSQTSLGVSGAVVAHTGGVTFGQPIGDTIGIVHAPGAAGARLANSPGVRIDHFGYALVPYLTPFNLNTIQIDPKGLPLDVQFDATSTQVTPHAGAVVMMTFKTKTGRMFIARLKRENGEPVAFGAEVFNAKNASLGVVGQYGKALLQGAQQDGQLEVRWNDTDGVAQSCSFPYHMPKPNQRKKGTAYEMVDATCTLQRGTAHLPGDQT